MKNSRKKTKKLIAMFVVVLILALSFSVSAAAVSYPDCICTNGWLLGVPGHLGWTYEGYVELCGGYFNEWYDSYEHSTEEHVVAPVSYIDSQGNLVPTSWVSIYGKSDPISITIPTATEACAIEVCQNLKKVNIGSIPEVYIEECQNLTDLTISYAEDITILGCESLSELTIPSGVKRVEIRSAAIESLVLPEGVEEVVLCCEKLKSITLPSSVKRYNLGGCTALTSVVLSDGIKSIPLCAFADCKSLQDIAIPDSVIAIGGIDYDGDSDRNDDFIENDGLYKIYTEETENTEKRIRYDSYYMGSFWNCTSLEEIDLPDSITNIGNYVFRNSGLKEVPNLKNVTEMDYGIFENCQNLTDVTINSKILGRGMFYGCTNLKTATLHEETETIRDGSFERSGLEKINIPDSVKTIEIGAFFATNLKSIYIPESVTYIGDHALYTDSLKDIYYEGSRNDWSNIDTHYAAYKFGTTIHYNSGSDCSCNCHKGGIAKFFFNFILFFQRIFGMNQECACGVEHY